MWVTRIFSFADKGVAEEGVSQPTTDLREGEALCTYRLTRYLLSGININIFKFAFRVILKYMP